MKRIVTHGWTAFLFCFTVAGVRAQVTDLDPTDQPGSKFGHSVANAGDVNGDGYGDIVVGAHGLRNSQGVLTGGAFLFLGSENGVSSTPDWSSTGDGTANSDYGCIVASAGDVNGDGYGDVLVAARAWSDGTYANEGRIYLYLGSETGLSPVADWVADPVDQNCTGNTLVSAAGVGDVNGDGFDDVLFGAPQWGDTHIREGRVFLYHGSASGLSSTPSAVFDPTNQFGANFGYSAAPAGDVNGDGFADVVVGAYSYGNTSGVDRDMGRTYVFHGSPSGLLPEPAWFSSGDEEENTFFGWSVDNAGDVDGDGYSDVIIGASWSFSGVGKVFVYPGSAQGLQNTPLWTSNESGTSYGISVSGAGDFNGDGYGDVVVADMQGAMIQASLFLGSANGPSPVASLTYSPGLADGMISHPVSGGGDLNGDGFDELLVGAQGWGGEGRVSVFDGFDFERELPAVTLQQFEADGVTPLVTGGLACESEISLGQNLVNNGSLGGFLGVEIEIKPVGVDFDGTGTLVSEGHVSSEPAIVMTSRLTAGPKHWRSRIIYPGTMGASAWFSHGNNTELDSDFEMPVQECIEITGPLPAPEEGGGGGRCGCTGAEALLMFGLVALWRRRIHRR